MRKWFQSYIKTQLNSVCFKFELDVAFIIFPSISEFVIPNNGSEGSIIQNACSQKIQAILSFGNTVDLIIDP